MRLSLCTLEGLYTPINNHFCWRTITSKMINSTPLHALDSQSGLVVYGVWCCTSWLSQSGHFTMFTFWRPNIITLWWQRTTRFKRSVICVQDITTLWCCRTALVLVLLYHCHLVYRIEKNDHRGMKLLCSQTRLLPIMTLHCTIIPGYCEVQL